MTSDEELVARWQKSRDQAALDDLRRRTRPLVQSQVNKYRANSVPMSVLEAQADQILVQSAGSYRLGTGATFRTHVFGNLRRLNRFSAARSNIATIPEARAQKIGVFQRVYSEMMDQKHRPPTATELADELNWPISEIMAMQRSVRRDIVSSEMGAPPTLNTDDFKTKQLIQDIWFELTPDEKIVFDHLTGSHGRRKLEKGQDIARATKFSPAKVSHLRTAIAKKLEPHL